MTSKKFVLKVPVLLAFWFQDAEEDERRLEGSDGRTREYAA
jgi:hypothetical protein